MFIEPMLLQASKNPFNDTNYITELKADGIRLQYSSVNGVKLYSRHQTDITSKFPEITTLPLPKNIVLDGELILTDEKGRPCFESIMSRFQVSSSEKIQYLSKTNPVHFLVFDVLYYNGDVTPLNLLKRKEILNSLIPIDEPTISQVYFVEGKAVEYFNLCKEKGLEGIVQKRTDSIYEVSKRSWAWQKVIAYSFKDCYISGYRKKKFGWLLSEKDSNGNMKSIGIMEFVPPTERKAFYKIANQLKIGDDKEFVYLDPLIRCRVKYRNLTSYGKLRIPSFEEFILN
ncbi:ATP-dependent DNA ligase [Sutcliffiella cohnii]|uniref:ATP-dependent DNA ligase n=1 Tax=Sutcliffiella cohnii TaxID=33932 RepID=UPI00082D7CD2|nr:RNA ligase family protein [Sutcliffiella cohnii]